jgi:hypothetical protein
VLAYQRYGRGTAAAFPIQDSWLWQMRGDTPASDETYQTFWRQTFRWLVSGTPGRVMVHTASEQTWIGEPVNLEARVVDRTYAPTRNATVTATIHTPSGTVVKAPLEGAVTEDGLYQAAYTPTEHGVYRIDVAARTPDDSLVTSDPAFIDVGSPTTEYVDAELRPSLLRRVANETGGRYYPSASASQLAKDMVYTAAGATTLERLDLWDMPVILLVLLLLVSGEWAYRRVRGLA